MFFKRRIYLDYASGFEGNPSSPHREGRAAKRMLEEARTSIARLLEVKADDIIFTSGATEANNLAIQGLAKPGAHFLYLPSAHASVVETMEAMREGGVVVEALPVEEGRVAIEKLRKMLRPETSLISMDAVCGETGTIWNTREVALLLRGSLALLHVDASQAPLTQKFSRAHFGADLLTLDAQKVGGDRAVGALVAHRTIPLQKVLFGGGQERELRPGTENPLRAHSFAVALARAAASSHDFSLRALPMRERLVEFLTKEIQNVYINSGAEVAPNILNLSLPSRDTDYLVALLDAAGYAVSTRSACETDSEEGSRAVFVLTGDPERAKSTLRISWGRETRERELMRFGKELIKQVAFLDNTALKSHY